MRLDRAQKAHQPEWDVLIDVDVLAAKEGEDWVWRGGLSLPPTHDRAIVYLSRGGSDAVVLREFDLSIREFVPDGFKLPESKSSVVWLDRDTLLLSSPLGVGHGNSKRPRAHGTTLAARGRSVVGTGHLRD
jgi:prolyl oligopeptidase